MCCAGGSTEVCLLQPMMAFKNAMQEGRPIPRNPIQIYRGLTLNILSMAPITASQFGTNHVMQQLLGTGPKGTDLTGLARFQAATVAGMASGLIATPSELIIIQQQRSGRRLSEEMRLFLSKYKTTAIYRGLSCAAAREGLYAGGYLGLFPVFRSMLDEQGASPYTSLILAGIAGGTFGAVASHPFDTAKTRMQAFMYDKPEYRTMLSSLRTIVQEKGVLGLWSGILPRMTRIILATFILNYIRTNIVDTLEQQRAPREHVQGAPAL
ncbi:mitochondrial carrier domain-containing protein [Dunaliella salina]|uniref:Mitochondrial carrier domain-containing protein n=1 Tax=Dunaliella salina TaxID=3046 RepID=A0ABQ7GCK4_DUNSA|nr:mitochondrial carrier domain-containing protein [Dunaliella salina]|eukprot:KAF5832324.1 mitochondrial carrier domain-containing protein [Dunaliella salina]